MERERHREQLEQIEEQRKAPAFVVHKFENRRIPTVEELGPLLGSEAMIDAKSNTLVVRLEDPQHGPEIRAVVSALDVPPAELQYRIEAVIVSAEISKGESFSIDWLGKYSYPVPHSPNWNVALGAGRVSVESDYLEVAVEKARESGKLAILARPSLVMSDGETARISSGREIPIPVANAQDGNVQTSVEYRSVALSLQVELEEIRKGVVLLSLSQVNADVAGSVLIGENEIPQLVSQEWETQLTPHFGRWYAVGGVATTAKEDRKRKGWLFLNRRLQDDSRREIGMYIRVVPVTGEDPPPLSTDNVTAAGLEVFPPRPALRAVPIK